MSSLDDFDNIQRFLSKINSQSEQLSLSTVTPTHTTEHGQLANHHNQNVDDIADSKHDSKYNESDGSTTPPHATLAGQDYTHLTSPEAHPRPSPHISGLTAPHNTPKTAASSPRLAAAHTHNEDVAEAFSDFVNTMEGRPLSASMWAPGSARYKPSVLSGARSTRVLTPTKAVEPNPAINDTFPRMSFRAADPDHKVGENLIGDRITQPLFSKPPPSSVNKPAVLTEKNHGDRASNTQRNPQAGSNEDFERPIHTDTIQELASKIKGANMKDSGISAHIISVEKENQVPLTSKVNVPPHLRASRRSSQKSDPSTWVLAQSLNGFSTLELSQTPSYSDQKHASSESAIKAETHQSCHEGLSPAAMSQISVPDSDLVKGTVGAATNPMEPKVTTDLAGANREKGPSESEDLENQTFFSGWPKSEERSNPGMFLQIVPNGGC